jgi:hypothetical protein
MFPPGRVRLATKPLPTGSLAVAKTVGMAENARVALLLRMTAPVVTMTSTFMRTNSATISAARTPLPSAQRYSMCTVLPSTQPSSRRRCTKAPVHCVQDNCVAAPGKRWSAPSRAAARGLQATKQLRRRAA